MQHLLEPFRRIPTAELYFLEPIRRLRQEGYAVPAPRAIGRTVYRYGKAGVIVRYATEKELKRLEAEGVDRIVYVIDDDLEAILEDDQLPESYRTRIRSFIDGTWRILTRDADAVVVPNAAIARIYGHHAIVAPPCWPLRPATTDHFDTNGPLRVILAGGASHAADVAMIADELAQALRGGHEVELINFSTYSVSPLQVSSMNRLRQTSWRTHKRALSTLKCHLALYPLRPTRLNRARSINKLLEHAILGAASLVSRFPALSEWPALAEAAQVIDEDDPSGAWRDAIAMLIQDREALRARALASIMAAHALDSAPPLMRTWRDLSAL
jgi:hypothetical protein